MNKPLSLVLIEQLFSFMEPLGFKSYEMELDEIAMSTLTNMMINEPKNSPYYLPLIQAGLGNILIYKDGITLTFVEKK